MTDSAFPEFPLSFYNAGRFEYLMSEPFARELWGYLSDKSHIVQMIGAVESAKPAIWPLLAEIEERFGACITSEHYPDDDVEVMVNNMIKQILEYLGYEHVGCGMLRHALYIKLSGVYRKRETV